MRIIIISGAIGAWGSLKVEEVKMSSFKGGDVSVEAYKDIGVEVITVPVYSAVLFCQYTFEGVSTFLNQERDTEKVEDLKCIESIPSDDHSEDKLFDVAVEYAPDDDDEDYENDQISVNCKKDGNKLGSYYISLPRPLWQEEPHPLRAFLAPESSSDNSLVPVSPLPLALLLQFLDNPEKVRAIEDRMCGVGSFSRSHQIIGEYIVYRCYLPGDKWIMKRVLLGEIMADPEFPKKLDSPMSVQYFNKDMARKICRVFSEKRQDLVPPVEKKSILSEKEDSVRPVEKHRVKPPRSTFNRIKAGIKNFFGLSG